MMSRMKLLVSLVALGGLTVACATKQGTGALIGTGAGGAVGAGVGAAVGGGKGAAIGGALGAAAGAATGAVIGNYMDKQEREMREKVQSAQIERKGDKLLVVFNSQILFDTNKTDLKPGAQKDLTDFAQVLRHYPETDILVQGHTDNTGSKEYNQNLAVARADSVVNYLRAQGVEPPRMTSQGFGENHPVAENRTASGRQLNRRVEIEIKPNATLRERDAAAAKQPVRGG